MEELNMKKLTKTALVLGTAGVIGLAGFGTYTLADDFWAGHNNMVQTNSDIDQLGAIIKEKNTQLTNAKSDLEDTKTQLKDAQNSQNNLRSKLTDAQNQLKSVQNQQKDDQNSFNQQLQAKEQEIQEKIK